jgi:Kef-type K+ transport system membrane component KefB
MGLPITDPIIQFTILVTAALAVQLTVERAHMPGLLGLLVLGVLLGPGGTGVLPEGPVIEMLGEIGLIYVMFIAGLEIDLRILRDHRTTVVVFGLLAFTLSGLPAAGGALLAGFDVTAAVLIGAVVSSHTLLAYPILLKLQLLRRLSVVTAVGGTIITDTLALLVLAVVLGTHGHTGTRSWLMPLVLLAALTVLTLWAVPRTSRLLFRRDGVSQAEKALFALAVLMLLASATELIGTDQILGAFLAGIAMNRVLAEREQLREHLEFVGRMLFIPFFFIWTGTLLDVAVLTQGRGTWVMAGGLLAAVLLGKAGASWITGRIFGFAARERLLMVGLTMPQAAATLAITITAREAGIFPEAVVDAVIIVIFLTCIAGPVLTERLGRRIATEPGPAADHARDDAMHPQVDHEEDGGR